MENCWYLCVCYVMVWVICAITTVIWNRFRMQFSQIPSEWHLFQTNFIELIFELGWLVYLFIANGKWLNIDKYIFLHKCMNAFARNWYFASGNKKNFFLRISGFSWIVRFVKKIDWNANDFNMKIVPTIFPRLRGCSSFYLFLECYVLSNFMDMLTDAKIIAYHQWYRLRIHLRQSYSIFFFVSSSVATEHIHIRHQQLFLCSIVKEKNWKKHRKRKRTEARIKHCISQWNKFSSYVLSPVSCFLFFFFFYIFD